MYNVFFIQKNTLCQVQNSEIVILINYSFFFRNKKSNSGIFLMMGYLQIFLELRRFKNLHDTLLLFLDK